MADDALLFGPFELIPSQPLLCEHGALARIERTVALVGDLDDSPREQFLEASEHTPITTLLKSAPTLRTDLA